MQRSSASKSGFSQVIAHLRVSGRGTGRTFTGGVRRNDSDRVSSLVDMPEAPYYMHPGSPERKGRNGSPGTGPRPVAAAVLHEWLDGPAGTGRLRGGDRRSRPARVTRHRARLRPGRHFPLPTSAAEFLT